MAHENPRGQTVYVNTQGKDLDGQFQMHLERLCTIILATMKEIFVQK